MPTISMFYGILVLMFFRGNRQHHLPHIHARCQDQEGVISIDDGTLLDGVLPPKQLKWCRSGLKFIKKNCKLTGSWLSTAMSLFELRHFSEDAHVN